MANVNCLNIKEHLLPEIQGIVGEYKIPEDDNIVWQQMQQRYFCNLLCKKQIYFKQLDTYGDPNDEKKLVYYQDNYINDDNKKNAIIEQLLSDFSKIVYVSCWYNNSQLSDSTFKTYAHDNGIAIGVRVSALKRILGGELNKSILKSYEEIYYGNTIYLDDNIKKVLGNCEEAIAPLFLKGSQHENDHELRIICVKDSLWVSDSDGVHLPHNINKSLYLNIGKITDFIEYIAIKEDTKSDMCFNNILKLNKLKIEKADVSSIKINGFDVYKIKEDQ